MEVLRKELETRCMDVFGKILKPPVDCFPFNEMEYMLCQLVRSGTVSEKEELDLRVGVIERNPHLPLFEMAPNPFGSWCEERLKKLSGHLVYPTKVFDPKYKGEYDLLHTRSGAKVESKSARVVEMEHKNKIQRTSRYCAKALRIESRLPFKVNFQQLKPECCDVFVLTCVWTNAIRHWVLSASEIDNFPKKYVQHRNSESYLIQVGPSMSILDPYAIEPENLDDAIRTAIGRTLPPKIRPFRSDESVVWLTMEVSKKN